MQYKVTEDANERIDNYLIKVLNKSRSKIQNLIKTENVKVNNKIIKNSYIVKQNDNIEINEIEEQPLSAKAEKIDLDIVYEDDDIIVVNKQNGLVVHPAVGNPTGTLVNGLMYHSKNLSKVNGEFRPGIVHRIDAFTTGLLVVAKNDYAHEFLARQLENKTTHRIYVALVWGVINEDTGTIDAPIGRDPYDRKKMCVTDQNSRNAITYFKVLERYKNSSLIECKLETGRTHQIRVHMNYIGHPIINDPVYGGKKNIDNFGQMLHAKEIGFINPATGRHMTFSCDVPDEFNKILEIYKNE